MVCWCHREETRTTAMEESDMSKPVLVVLAASGDEKQLSAHIVGNLKAGNSKETLLAAMVQAMPYIGMPPALTAINLIKSTDAENYRPIYEN